MARSTSSTRGHSMGAGGVRTNTATVLVGLFLILLAFALGWALLVIWPEASIEDGRTQWLNLTEVRALLIAMVTGALGSYIHAATSFSSFAGNRRLASSWIWWFLLRPIIGACLALVIYFVLRSGLMLSGPLGDVISPFGIAAVSAIAGLFAKQAVDKLKSISDTTFDNSQDAERVDKL